MATFFDEPGNESLTDKATPAGDQPPCHPLTP
jgi:hypothetical protein